MTTETAAGFMPRATLWLLPAAGVQGKSPQGHPGAIHRRRWRTPAASPQALLRLS
ncbi:hypothetical protein [Accumulibacter sp.]|uniref:hypothetical protein n=1 Tax=Accumulibacter sp. TaxID=2053492 RepID=UPI0025D86143|nr:hypothetical protein [Accumulibacter sp.]MCM8636679.1 hypothetical protein [Accumulibacter sp.]MCM8640330.1 hypothetical protein [Accumulibacter sp.]